MCSCGGSTPSNPTPPTAPCGAATREVNERVSETISNAPEEYDAWNGTYSWRSKFTLTTNSTNCTVTATVKIKVTGTVTEAQKTAWKDAIEQKWNNKVKLCCGQACCPDGSKVNIKVEYVDSGEHYTVTAQNPGATSDGRAGLGGTTSMTDWGVNDTVDVTHEFGHMLGAPEEYFTTDGHDYTDGGTKTGFRDPDGGIMNNPSNDPQPQNYDLIRRQAQAAMGSGTSCTTKAQSAGC